MAAAIAVLATPIVALVGVEGQTADYAATYLRIVSIGIPSFFLALGGQGYLRGVAELRSPLVLIVLGNALNVVLEVLFVYGFDWGIEGSAWGTAVAQSCMGAGFVWLIARRVGRADLAPVLSLAARLISVGKFLFVRTASLIGAFLLAGAVVARFGDAALGAYQISFQLWIFLALVLDAIAIAGQIIVGRELGAGRRRACVRRQRPDDRARRRRRCASSRSGSWRSPTSSRASSPATRPSLRNARSSGRSSR